MDYLATTDPLLADLIHSEQQRQNTTLNLIASESYTPPEIHEAVASVFSHKYAEGYPGRRYYAGCEYADKVEQLAIARCKELFGCEHANVQPHAGSQANMAVYHALLNPGDTIMGMDLAAGGHLTHGHKVNFSGRYYHAITYGVDPTTHRINYDELRDLARAHKPNLIIVGASAYPRQIDFATCATIAHETGAYLLVDMAHISGLVAGNVHPSPIPHADVVTSTTHKTLHGPRGGLIMCKQEHAQAIDKAVMPGTQGGPFMHAIAAKAACFARAQTPAFCQLQQRITSNARALAQSLKDRGCHVVSGGTDTHMCILDIRSRIDNGKTAESLLEKVGITTSRSCIPNDPNPPWRPSGLRLGTTILSSRGMESSEMEIIARLIDETLTAPNNPEKQKEICKDVLQLCTTFPVTQ